MTPTARDAGEALYARLYDAMPVGWPGEVEAYRAWAREAAGTGPARVLEVACGTGRVSIPLSDDGCEVTGIDASSAMIEVARTKRAGGSPRWVLADMRSFDLGRRFDLVLIPAHSFQFMTTAGDQVATLRAVRRHLDAGSRLVVHLDRPEAGWLASLPLEPAQPESREVGGARVDPATGQEWRLRSAWSWEPSIEVATVHLDWVRVDGAGRALESIARAAMPLKVIGRVEMEHALSRAGFAVEALYGDFFGGPLSNDAGGHSVWVARAI